MGARRHSLALVLAGALLGGVVATSDTAPAYAQAAPTDAQKDEAKTNFKDGKKAFDAGDFAAALPFFQKADALYPGAAPKYKIAESFDKLGRAEEAVAAYRTFIDSKPSETYADRMATAGKRIVELEATLPGVVTIVVTPPGLAGLAITVDGAPVQGPEVRMQPGAHTVVVSADGHQPATQQVNVTGGQKTQMPVNLLPAAITPPPPPPAEPSGERSNVPAYVTLGIAGAGVILGTVFGIQALGAKSDFDEDPTVDNADKAERAALIADMSFGVALTFGITGAVLLFSGDDTPEEAKALPVMSPYVGLKGGGMAATWEF